jgi:hypothetical protein
LRLQKTAGNRAVASVAVQSLGVEDVKDWWHHLKGDDKENEKDPAEQSEDIALHAKELTEAGQAAFGHMAAEAMRRGDSEGLAKAQEIAERFKHGGELLETGSKIFSKANKAAKVLRQLDEMRKACEELNDADLSDPRQQRRGANALDRLFGGAGELAKELLPDGPWTGYFTFLEGFKKYDFFGHWTEFIHDYTDRLDKASRSE